MSFVASIWIGSVPRAEAGRPEQNGRYRLLHSSDTLFGKRRLRLMTLQGLQTMNGFDVNRTLAKGWCRCLVFYKSAVCVS